MNFAARKALYREIEKARDSRVITYVTSDRQGLETAISPDCVDLFVDLLDRIGPTKKISLILHTDGGQTLGAWRIVNLLRTFCDELEVMIPSKALSAGTLISIGADKLVMSKQAALGPIDPSVNNLLNPQVNINGQLSRSPVSVESVLGFISVAKEELKLSGEPALTQVLSNLTAQVHPLVIGEVYRTRTQIRFLATKLVARQIADQEKITNIVNFLCADSGSHDYTINRREAKELGLNIEKPSEALYGLLKAVHESFRSEMNMASPWVPQLALGGQPSLAYKHLRGLVESTEGCFGYVTEGELAKSIVPGPMGQQELITNRPVFEGWRQWI